MKNALLAFATFLLLLAGRAQAQTVIQYWNFNTLTPTTIAPVPISQLAPIPADSTADSAGANRGLFVFHALTGTVGNSLAFYDTLTADTSATLLLASGRSLNLHNPTDSMEARFYVPCGGYKDVIWIFGGQTDSGAYYLHFSYSIDSGATWLTNGIKSVNGITGSIADSLGTSWQLNTIVFDSTADNNNKLVVRITFAGGYNRKTGSDAFDNVRLVGTPTYNVSVANISSQKDMITLYPNPASASITIKTSIVNQKAVIVYNTTGQEVYHTISGTKTITVPITALATGMYYVLIRDNETGEQYTAKFLKK